MPSYAAAHLGGLPELMVLVVPVAVFLIVRRVQFARERRREQVSQADSRGER